MNRPLSRREAFQLAALAAAGSLTGAAAAQSPTETGKRDLLKAPVQVPSNFVGIHFHHWPQGNPPSPAPTYGYGTVRSHDYGIAWDNIETAPGKFNWDRMDGWVQTHSSSGMTLIYTVYGTPAWASSRNTVKDAYGFMGAGAPPTNLSVLSDFVTALVSRYNSKGERKIQFIEIWNEPHFLQNDRGFWWGTTAQLADVGRTVSRAAKASDPAVKVLSPAFDGLPQGHLTYTTTGISAGLRQYLGTRDATGTPPSQWFDALAIHTYDADIIDPTHGLEGMLLQVRETLNHFNIDVPIYTTETGYSEKAPFNTMPVQQQGSLLRRQSAVQAALGVKALCFYSHDDQFCGNPSKHPELSAAINDVQIHIAGSTLRQVSVLPSGQVSVVTRSGAFTW
jgi:hypothetical protein